jgi:Ni,Fe-hydrogenase III large subunit
VYEIPVGPVHAGLIEPGNFRLSVVGETILKLKPRLWYVHKGSRSCSKAAHRTPHLPLAARISGDTSAGHSLAYCRAVEDALNLPVPESAQRMRAMLLELERLYNHVGDLGALCNDVGHGILNTHALRIRQRLLRLNADITGHRPFRGAAFIGGAEPRQVPEPEFLAAIAADIRQVVDLALGNTLVAERFTSTAVLSAERGGELRVLGYVAWAQRYRHRRPSRPCHHARPR